MPPREPILLTRPAEQHNPLPTVAQLQQLSRLMDGLVEIPVLRTRLGLDALLGLFPGLGDLVTSLVSLYILQAAHRYGVSRITLTRMAINIGADWLLGSVPLLGDVFDIYWKSNQKNVELLQRHIEASPTQARRLRGGDWLFFFALAGVLIAVLLGSLAVVYFAFLGLRALVASVEA